MMQLEIWMEYVLLGDGFVWRLLGEEVKAEVDEEYIEEEEEEVGEDMIVMKDTPPHDAAADVREGNTASCLKVCPAMLPGKT